MIDNTHSRWDRAGDFSIFSAKSRRHCYRLFSHGVLFCGWVLISPRYLFSIVATAVLSAKFIQIRSHLDSLFSEGSLIWTASLFYQDVAMLLIYKLLLDRLEEPRGMGVVASIAMAFVMLHLAAISISCFLLLGVDMQWHNLSIALDPTWWVLIPQALATHVVVLASLLLAAKALQNIFNSVAESCVEVLLSAWMQVRHSGSPPADQHRPAVVYFDVDDEDGAYMECVPIVPDEFEKDAVVRQYNWQVQQCQRPTKAAAGTRRTLAKAVLLTVLISTVLRPSQRILAALSWTLPLLPIIDTAKSHGMSGRHSSGRPVDVTWEKLTALSKPISLPWLPQHTHLKGFQDWYEENSEHYNASADPLKINNLDQGVLRPLAGKLSDTPIRHVVLIVMESIRKDVFPLKRDDYIYRKLKNSFRDKKLPDDAMALLSNLTPAANYLTGDYVDGFDHEDLWGDRGRRRGGISASQAITSSTYTIKSLTGLLCGTPPTVSDWNREHVSHIYQPCMPHILDALNALGQADAADDRGKDFAAFKWRSMFMQSASSYFDNMDLLMEDIGFTKDNFIAREALESDAAKRGKPIEDAVNAFSLPEFILEDYVRDAFRSAKRSNERVFLSHLTSTTHHDWVLPPTETPVKLGGSADVDLLSDYLNTVKYSDNWLKKVLEIMEDEGVADETLVVVTGDHGVPVSEGLISTYNNAEEMNFRVPLVFSHPSLPVLEITNQVSSVQVLPTILDLLIQTGSLAGTARKAAQDLLANYEGQSIIRPLHDFSEKTGQGHWQFSIINPGGSMLSIHDARFPSRHLIMPVTDVFEWQFMDLGAGMRAAGPRKSYEIESLVNSLRKDHGAEVAAWVKEASVVGEWWLQENRKRWRY